MALSPRTVRISAALLVSALFVAAGWFLSPSLEARLANAGSTHDALEAYTTKDSDTDGLPDWKESLYGTDPANPHSADPSMTDGQAVAAGKIAPKFSSEASSSAAVIQNTPEDELFNVPSSAPGSVTDTFAQSFLQQYVNSGAPGVGASTDSTGLLNGLMSQLSAQVTSKLGTTYTPADFKSSSSVTVNEYVAAVETVMKAHENEDTGYEISSLIDRMVNQNDDSARTGLLALSKMYAGMAADLVQIPAPTSLVTVHQTLIQSFDTMADATVLVANYKTDPLATAAALASFKPAFENASSAVGKLIAAVRLTGEPAPGAPGAYLISIFGTGIQTQ